MLWVLRVGVWVEAILGLGDGYLGFTVTLG